MIFSRSPRAPRAPARLSVDRLEGRDVPAVAASYAVTQDWGTGFQAEVKLTNPDPAAVPFTTLGFTLAAPISSVWDAKQTGRVGNTYTVTNAGWNAVIPAGGSVTFGFVAGRGATAPAPASDFVLNGVPLGGGSGSLPALSVADVSVAEGNSGTTAAKFVVTLSAAAAAPVTVNYATADGTAESASDYTAASGTLTFAPGETSKAVTVNVRGDTAAEPDEAFALNLSAPTAATLARGAATAAVRNDDAPPAGTLSATFRSASDWGGGMTGEITVRNGTSNAVSDWRLAFDLPGRIDAIWNAAVQSRAGNRYVVAPAAWNKTIPAGGSVVVGFNALPGGLTAVNLVVAAGGVSPPPANRPPTAAADAARTAPGTAAVVAVLQNDADPDGDALAVTGVGKAAHGTAVRNSDGTVTYTPAAGYTGPDSFTYTVSDGRGGTASGTVSMTVAAPDPGAPSAWPASVFAPYIDATLWPTYDFAAVARDQGVTYFTLAFVTADPQNRPAWGGYAAYAITGTEFDTQMRDNVAAVRALGGDVAVSFGGAAGRELAEVITDVTALTAAYRSVIDAYGLTHIDFDVEGAATADKPSVDRRNQAIARLQADARAAGRELHVRYTLPVLPTGLTPDGVYVLRSARTYGVKVGTVNVMAMDYGGSAAPNPAGRMGDYAIQAGNSLFAQLTDVWGATTTEAERWRMVGLTPMIGMNDVTTEVFDQPEAREVAAWAAQQGIGLLSFWSLNRDRQHPNGALGYVDLNSSSILQSPFEFSLIFKPFTR